MEALITIKYTKPYQSVTVSFFPGDRVEFPSIVGVELSTDQLLEFAAAGGGDIKGWSWEDLDQG